MPPITSTSPHFPASPLKEVSLTKLTKSKGLADHTRPIKDADSSLTDSKLGICYILLLLAIYIKFNLNLKYS